MWWARYSVDLLLCFVLVAQLVGIATCPRSEKQVSKASAGTMAIALADVGKSVREILYGTPKEGTFTYDQKVTYSTKTADGVVRLALSSAASLTGVPIDLHLQL